MNVMQEHVAAIESKRAANILPHVLRYLMLARGDIFRAVKNSERNRAWPEIQAILKAATPAGSTQIGNWAQPLAEFESAVSAFLPAIRNYGAFDQALPYMIIAPLRTRIVSQTIGVTGGVIAENASKVISNLQLSGQNLSESKAVAIIVRSEEMLRDSVSAVTDLGPALAAGVAVMTDQEFIRKISLGLTPITSGGSTADKIWQDLQAALAAITISANAKLFLFTTPTIAKAISTKTSQVGTAAFPGMKLLGGDIGPATLVISDGVPAGQMVLADVSQLVANGGTLEFDASRETILNMETTPDSPPVASTIMTSLWHNNLHAAKCERLFGVERPRNASVAIISGISY